MERTTHPRRTALRAALCAACLTLSAATASHSSGPTTRGARLDVNRLSLPVWNQGSFAYDLVTFGAGVEFPRGTGIGFSYAAGIWLGGKAGAELRTAVAEFGTDFVPGPVVGGGFATDTLRFLVYKVARGDTAGWSAWMANAVPMGAPTSAGGDAPGLVGDQTLWTVFNDMATVTESRGGPRASPPVGVEVQLTAYAFDRPGPVRDAAFLRWRIVHKGAAALDSAYLGLFLDPKVGTDMLAACDTSLDLGYAFHLGSAPGYGAAAPSIGLQLLRGPRDRTSGEVARATSFVVYPNGSDPQDSLQLYRSLHGIRPWGAEMVDSSTGLVTNFWSSGDPVAGTGWVASNPIHPHTVLASGPFQLASGDTQTVDAALVVGWGPDHIASVAALKANAAAIRELFDEDFTSLPPPTPVVAHQVLQSWPNPAQAVASVAYRVPAPGGAVEIAVYDLGGRRVRTLVNERQPSGPRLATWDGTDEDGASAPAGIYFVRGSAAGVESGGRIVIVR